MIRVLRAEDVHVQMTTPCAHEVALGRASGSVSGFPPEGGLNVFVEGICTKCGKRWRAPVSTHLAAEDNPTEQENSHES